VNIGKDGNTHCFPLDNVERYCHWQTIHSYSFPSPRHNPWLMLRNVRIRRLLRPKKCAPASFRNIDFADRVVRKGSITVELNS